MKIHLKSDCEYYKNLSDLDTIIHSQKNFEAKTGKIKCKIC